MLKSLDSYDLTMNLAEEAFRELYPEREFPSLRLRYSGRFKSYNANVTYRENDFVFNLARDWKEIDEAIVKGLLQHLLLKVMRRKIAVSPSLSMNIDLYNSFMRNLHRSVKKEKSDPVLAASFERLNSHFFEGTLERPNLEWGNYSKAMLGNYNYHTDTIRISKHFLEASQELLDYIMYHEMLHKKLKFKSTGSSTCHHTPEFKHWERQYPGYHTMDNQIKAHLRYRRTPRDSGVRFTQRRRRSLLWWLQGL